MLNKKELEYIKEFQNRMYERMKEGNKKYKRKYLKKSNEDIIREAEDEIIDFANYMMQIFIKLKGVKI